MCTLRFRRGSGDSMHTRGKPMQHGKPHAWSSASTNREPVTDGPGAVGVTERPVVLMKLGNASGGKGP